MPQADIIRDTNVVYLTGIVTVAPRFIFNQRGYDIREGVIEVPRLSGTVDRLPFASEACNIDWIKEGSYISIDGHMQHRGKVRYPDVENRLVAFVDMARIASPSLKAENIVALTGHLCRKPSFRVTPRGKSICELLVAVANGNGTQEYCFCVAWGKVACEVSMLNVGAAISAEGRFQSREYTKRLDNGETITKVTHEISLNTVDLNPSHPSI